MIPHLIQRLWICPPGPAMPAEFRRYGERWRLLHPAWGHHDWDTVTRLLPMRNQALYDADAPDLHRRRSDIARLEILWRFGGVYVDADMEPVKALDPLLERVAALGATAFLAWSSNRWHGQRLVSNAVMAAEPAHPWIGKAIEALPASYARHRGAFLAMQSIHYLTDLLGPLGAHGISKDGVLVLPEATFFPRSIAEQRAGRPVRTTARTYAIHHWAHSRKLQEAARG